MLHRVVAQEGREQVETGGRWATWLATCGNALMHEAVVKAAGSTEDSPRIMSVKKIPIESTWAEFWNVVVIPDPAPRWSAGRLFITAARSAT